MSGADFGSLVDQLGAASLDGRDVIRDLRSELKEARRVIRELREARDVEVDRVMRERVEQAVESGLAEYRETIKVAMDEAVAKVDREFERLFLTYMRGRKGDRAADLRTLLGDDG